MDQRKLMDNANTITDMAKVYRTEKITPRARVKAALELSACRVSNSKTHRRGSATTKPIRLVHILDAPLPRLSGTPLSRRHVAQEFD